ncbi:hypothetical protein PF008_g20233 [Phytophthora fragariae]|uniref:Uncharacterized protein n=1 Tax=Phytophthora fragariae TaxID=53985 RepID=A0A6G0R033_9STRA|nr:hypothetical protein PF008_g20233 [Phytophthora fragariae]
MLTRENIVHEATTGLEDGLTKQHAVLASLLHSRLFLPKFRDSHVEKSAFHWIANFLLVNFMELSLVWNKITLLITADAAPEESQVSWDEEAPEQCIGILIPVGMEYDALIDFIYEHVEDLEFVLEEKSTRAQSTVKKSKSGESEEEERRHNRRGHFYQYEVVI